VAALCLKAPRTCPASAASNGECKAAAECWHSSEHSAVLPCLWSDPAAAVHSACKLDWAGNGWRAFQLVAECSASIRFHAAAAGNEISWNLDFE